MTNFKKGNNFTFKQGNVPHNRKRTKVAQVKSDSHTPKYTRLTRKMYNMVVNDPYTSPEEKVQRSTRAAKLLRPKSDKVLASKMNRKSAVTDKR